MDALPVSLRLLSVDQGIKRQIKMLFLFFLIPKGAKLTIP